MLRSGDEELVLAAAREVGGMTIDEAFAVLLVLADARSGRYGRAAVRFHARVCRDLRADLDDGMALAGALRALGSARDTARRESAGLLIAHLLDHLGVRAARREAHAWRLARRRRSGAGDDA